MACQGCATCCRKLIVGLTAGDLKREPRLRDHAVPMVAVTRRKLLDYMHKFDCTHVLAKRASGAACVFLDETNGCTIYATRPDICRAFQCRASLFELSTRQTACV
jgi:Fe-S-cluster containining protein